MPNYIKVGKNWQRVEEAEPAPEPKQPEIKEPAPQVKKTKKKAAN
jgi:hypothetical protein